MNLLELETKIKDIKNQLIPLETLGETLDETLEKN
jgi:hypothetical protein